MNYLLKYKGQTAIGLPDQSNLKSQVIEEVGGSYAMIQYSHTYERVVCPHCVLSKKVGKNYYAQQN
jgi:hypothetical protein